MRDGSDDGDAAGEAAPGNLEQEYPVDRLKARFRQNLGGRPLMVYFVLFAGAAVLLLLLVIVWISATGGDDEPPPCFQLTFDEARTAIQDGRVDRIKVVYDRDRPQVGPSYIDLELADESCRTLPQGADNSDQLYMIIGIVDFYNRQAERRIRAHYQAIAVPTSLLVTSTPTPSPTQPPTATPSPEPTAAPATPTAPPTATETASPPPATATSTATPAPTRPPVIASPAVVP